MDMTDADDGVLRARRPQHRLGLGRRQCHRFFHQYRKVVVQGGQRDFRMEGGGRGDDNAI